MSFRPGPPLPPQLEHISASMLKMFARCAEQGRRRYILGEKQPPAAALQWGSADHAAIEHNLTQKITTYEDLPTPEVVDRFDTEFDQRFFHDHAISDLDFDGKASSVDEKKALAGTWKDQGVKMVALYHEQVCPTVQPSLVEEKFRLELDGLPPLDGRIDILACRALDEDDEEMRQAARDLGMTSPFGGTRLIDRKTSSRRKTALSPEETLQLRIYQLVHPVTADLHVSVKGEKPQVQTGLLLPEPTEAETEALLWHIRQTVERIAWCYETYGPDEPWPGARFDGWFGGESAACGFCGFRPTCPHWAT